MTAAPCHTAAGPRGFVFNLQRYSVHDGPGIRTSVFLKGCPLACAWCHNPEGIKPARQLLLVETKCVRCSRCVEACAKTPPNGHAVLPTGNPACDLCGACVEACTAGARTVVGTEQTVQEVLAVVRRDRMFYEESGGGVTFSGGEPLLQPAFLIALLRACRAEGFHTAVDTSGYGRREDLLAVAAFTNLFLFDLKLMDDEQHAEFTGVSNARILDNLRALSAAGAAIWLRLPLVAGVNDSDRNLAAAARLAASLPGVQRVSLLPYHRTGVAKARRTGFTRGFQAHTTPTAAALERAAEPFRLAGLDARVGGG